MNNMPPSKESKTTAGAAGVGGGTLLVVIANALPEGSKVKPWLIWASPSVSVFLGGLWLWLQARIANYLRDREVDTVMDKAKRTIEDALNNPNTSKEHRKQLRVELEALERVRVGRYMEKIQSLKILSEKDILDRNEQMQSSSLTDRA